MNNDKSNLNITPQGEVITEVTTEVTTEENIKSILESTGEYPESYVQELIQEIVDRKMQVQRDLVLILPPIEKKRTKAGIWVDVAVMNNNEKLDRFQRYHRVVGVGQITNGWTIEAGKHAVWVSATQMAGFKISEIPVGDKLIVGIPVYNCEVVVEYNKLVKKEGVEK